ncbi:putative tryptophan synthase beta chain 1 [Leptospira santarosai str. HAI134]|nr:putative tryptophan synthase beta chain 1 [Leptospira santarosai str. HAI134]
MVGFHIVDAIGKLPNAGVSAASFPTIQFGRTGLHGTKTLVIQAIARSGAFRGALDAFLEVCRIEGIIPALESAHAFRFAKDLAKSMGKKRTFSSVFPVGEIRMLPRLQDLEKENFLERHFFRFFLR